MHCCFSAETDGQPTLLTPLSHILSERLLGRSALLLIPILELADRLTLPIQEGVGIAVDSANWIPGENTGCVFRVRPRA